MQGCSCKECLEDQGLASPPRVLLRLMQTYDMYITVIYMSYPFDQ
jgi:hypothetical protein